ncbi:cation:proton antiporter [Halostella sp. JP-L12]|uniref:cation:proton antiporter n=1 Tax=Halostella TaxID=1843185 RepID=UPI000EF7E633|nr:MULTISPECIES: cation:proton antiporter [Halostella]NHN46156.1 cation:proton antiporter [Halostella sp. JP-L12]
MAATSLLEVGIMLAAIAIGGSVASRLGQSVIPFYVVTGILVGPEALGRLTALHVSSGEFVEVLAELGIVFLLFFLGLEFSLDRLLANRQRITAAGTVDLLINFPVGVLIGLALGWSLTEAMFLGGIVYISSSAVITKSLIDLGWIANDESDPMLGTLVFEDLAIAVYLTLMSAVVLDSGDLADVLTDLVVAMGFLLALLAVAHYGTSLVERLVAAETQELRLLRSAAVTVLAGGIALELGVSEAVAAFFVGMAVGSTSDSDAVEHLLMPIRDLFAAVFFFWIGLETDPAALVATAGLLALLVALTTPTKLVSGYLGGRSYDLDARRSFRVGAGMVTRGEFSLVIATLAAAGGTEVLRDTIPSVTVGYVLVMSVLGTTLMQYSDAVWDRLPAP